jgi:type I restriction enzyme S subunit
MAVKPGYKQTEVGVIPEEWHVSRLSSLTSLPIQNGLFNEPARKGRGCKLINVIDLYFAIPIDTSQLERFDATKDEIVRFGVEQGDVFFTRSSLTADGIARCNIFRRAQNDDIVFDCHIIRVRPNLNRVEPDFLARYCSTSAARHYLVANAKTTTMTTVDQRVIANLPVLLPPTKAEQRAIATALSDTDALIDALDRLIAKKRDIKQAAMQRLLTGKKRLPGFCGEWRTLEMADRSTLKARIGWQGLTTEEYLKTGEYYLVTGIDLSNGRIEWSRCCFVSIGRYAQDRNIQLRPKDILLTKDGTIGKVGFVYSLPGPATLNSGVFVIRPKKDSYEPQFLYYVLTSCIFDEFLTRLRAGSTISHLYQKDFVTFSCLAPSTLSEQTAIADVLADMDAELAALKARREKTCALKQGMAQELLAGRTRLV